MGDEHPPLDWLARRRAGESAAYVAHHAGVTEDAVLKATNPYGPFPRPSRQLGRTILSGEELRERSRRWVEARRRGHSATSIARADGVAHQYVSKVTRAHGPFPATEVIEEWVEGRRQGRTLMAIAEQFELPVSTIRRETAPFGPFRRPGPRLLEDVWGGATRSQAGSGSAQ